MTKDQVEPTTAESVNTCTSEKQTAPVSFWYMLLLTSFTLGTASVYGCNQQVLQITARRFFDILPGWLPPLLFIGLVNSVQELGQIIATPYAAWKSDRIWTRIGRRRPLVMLVAPILAVAIFLVPRCPTLGMFLIVVMVLQLAEGAELAVLMPSIHDSVPDKQRSLAIGMSQMIGAIPAIILGRYVMGLMDPGLHRVAIPFIERLGIHSPSIMVNGAHHWPYTVAAVMVAVTSIIYLLVMRERYVPPRTTERFRLIKYSKDLFKLREHRLIWMIFMFQSLFMATASEYLPTLGKLGMRLTQREYGWAYSWRGVTQLLLAVLLGYVFSKLNKRKAVCIGVCIYSMLPATFALFFMKTKLDLAIFFASHVLGFLVLRLNFVPLVMEYTSPKNVGTIMGFSSAVSGISRMIVIPLFWFLIGVFHNNYRLPFYATYVGAIACIIALLMMRPAEQVPELADSC